MNDTPREDKPPAQDLKPEGHSEKQEFGNEPPPKKPEKSVDPAAEAAKQLREQHEAMRAAVPDVVRNFMEPKCSGAVHKILQGTDTDAVVALVDDYKRQGYAPSDWPEVKLALHPQANKIQGKDPSTAIILAAISASPESDPGKYIPKSYYQVRDWVWIVEPDQLAFIWSTPHGSLQAIHGPDVARAQDLHDALTKLAPGVQPSLPEPTMAAMLLGMHRALKSIFAGDEIAKVMEITGECAGMDEKELEMSLAATRRTVWNHLLMRSPAFVAFRCHVTLDPGAQHAPITHLCVVMASWAEINGENGVRAVDEWASQSAKNAAEAELVKLSVNPARVSSTVITDASNAFEAFVGIKGAWEEIPISEYYASPDCIERIEEWDDLVKL